MVKPNVGAQLIIWGKRSLEDLPSVLDEVSSLGYDGVETSINAFEKVSDPKGLLTGKGLSLAGLHMSLRRLDEKLVDSALTFLQKTNSRYLLFSGAGGKENTEENYRRSAKLLERIGRKAAEQGVKVCYHNHWQEIVNDAMGTRIILDETSSEFVSLCVDTYWVECGGLSPTEFIKENLGRVAYLHLKDGTEEGMKRREFLELGQGILDFPQIHESVKPVDIEWFVVEQDRTERTPKESMAISRKYLKGKMGL